MKQSLTHRAIASLMAATIAVSTLPAGADISRGAFVSALWEQSGKSAAAAAAPFIDVHSGERTYTAILWAAETGVVAGVRGPSPMGDGPLTPATTPVSAAQRMAV